LHRTIKEDAASGLNAPEPVRAGRKWWRSLRPNRPGNRQQGDLEGERAGDVQVDSLFMMNLIRAGADLNVTAKFHLSATMLAVINGHESIARALAAAGADLSLTGSGAPGFAGKTAAQLARDRGFEVLAHELSERVA
jgi:hypothetical protein